MATGFPCYLIRVFFKTCPNIFHLLKETQVTPVLLQNVTDIRDFILSCFGRLVKQYQGK